MIPQPKPHLHAVPPNAPRPRLPWKWLLVGLVVVGVAVAARFLPLREFLRTALDWVEGLGGWGVLAFVLMYVVASVLFLPASALTLGAGALYGVARGSLIVSLASTLAATAAFLIGRHLAREAVARRIGGHPTFAALDRAVADEGWKIVLLTRLSPLFPFNLLNYGFGLTRVRLAHYVVASWIGMMPGTVLYVWLGALAGDGAVGRERSPAEWALYGVGLLATVIVTVLITRLARRALDRKIHVSATP